MEVDSTSYQPPSKKRKQALTKEDGSFFSKKDVQDLVNEKSSAINFVPVDRNNEMWSTFKFIQINFKKFPDFI